MRMMNRRSQYCIRVGSPLPGSGYLPASADRAVSPDNAITCLQPRRSMMSLRLRLSLFGSLPPSRRSWAILTNFDQAQPWPTCAPLESLDPSRRSTLTSLSTPHLGLMGPILTNFDQIRRATVISVAESGAESRRRVTASGRSADFNPPGATVGRAARFLTPGKLRAIRRNEFRAPMRSAGFSR